MDKTSYQKKHQFSLTNSEQYWQSWKEELVWEPDSSIDISYNCLERNIEKGLGDRTAFLWLNEDGEEKRISYQELLELVNKMANMLTSLGVAPQDTVTLYMPAVIEAAALILACARIGAIHNVVYAGFSADALRDRFTDLESKVIITADFTQRRGRKIDLLSTARKAIEGITDIKTLVLVRDNTGLKENEYDLDKLVSEASSTFTKDENINREKLFVLYTSGTTGKPKGITHAPEGYTLYAYATTKTTFDLTGSEVFWCTADMGWITGHTYLVYGPLLCGITSIIFEGAPDYPSTKVWWDILEKYKVNIFYTSPTAIRMHIAAGDDLSNYNFSDLKIIGSVGEPLNETAYEWYLENIGKNRCHLVDTWWQTETGGHMITTYKGTPGKPGYAGFPCFGVDARVVDKTGREVGPGKKGYLVIKNSPPGMFVDCWKNTERYRKYFDTVAGFYFSGDFAIHDADGRIRILGRADDVINVGGHNIGSAEVENAINTHSAISESAVVGVDDPIKGQKIVAFVVVKKGQEVNEENLESEANDAVIEHLGKLAQLSDVVIVEKLPKTRSGKIMRRMLRAQYLGEDLGDTSTLEA